MEKDDDILDWLSNPTGALSQTISKSLVNAPWSDIGKQTAQMATSPEVISAAMPGPIGYMAMRNKVADEEGKQVPKIQPPVQNKSMDLVPPSADNATGATNDKFVSPVLPGFPSSVSPEQFASYFNKQKEGIDKYGADSQMDMQNAINDRRNSFGYKATDALKGFGDALMMGVARAGNPGWQNQFQEAEAQRENQNLATLRGANESQLQSVSAKMQMDKLDPNSILSKSAQTTYAPLFKDLGYNPQAIKTMSAANIEMALSMMTAYGGKKVEAMIKQYELEAERARIAATIANNKQEREIAKEKEKNDVLANYSKMGKVSQLLHPEIAREFEKRSGMDETSKAKEHPLANQALEWAKSHPNDPKAEEIIRRLVK